jgi:thiol:disulfide interchange protein DsbD
MKKLAFAIITVVFAFCQNLSAENTDELVDLGIYSNVKQIQIGSDFYVAIKLSVADEWHIYWKNPGDSGLPTEVEWTLPKGVETVGGLKWQTPERIEWSGMVNYGFENDVYLIQKFKTSRTVDLKSIEITANVSWLICKEKCIPQNDEATIKIAVDEMFEKSSESKLILDLLATAPKTFNSEKSIFKAGKEKLEVKLLDMPVDVAEVTDLFVVTDEIVENSAKIEIKNNKNSATVELKLSPYATEMPVELELLVLYKDKNGSPKSYETIINNK